MAQAIITRRKGKGVNKDLPEQITAFTAVADNTPSITLSWENPTEYWAGTLIVKKAGSAPEGVNDGEKIYNGTGTSFVDTVVEYDTEYFYRAYPYNSKKQYQTEVLTVSAMPVAIPDNFADATWAQIDAASTSGNIPSTWVVGSEKDITLSTGEVLTLVIVGINHDDLADGSGKAGLTIGLKNLMAEKRAMNRSTNKVSFVGSAMYSWLTGTLIPQLPEDLQAVIKTVNKKTSAGNKSTSIQTDAMQIFMFAEIEVFGLVSKSVDGEGSQYDYFTTEANRVKYLSNGSGSANNWWERSPNKSETDGYCLVSSSGGISAVNNGGNLYGVCFGFCV